MLKWLAKLLGIDMRSKYQRGYDYVMRSYSQNPTTQRRNAKSIRQFRCF